MAIDAFADLLTARLESPRVQHAVRAITLRRVDDALREKTIVVVPDHVWVEARALAVISMRQR